MDRQTRAARWGRLGLALAAVLVHGAGCRSTPNEVPPGKPYQTTGTAATPPSVGFSSEANPAVGGMTGLYGNVGPGGMMPDGRANQSMNNVTYGTPTPASANFGAPTQNLYGAPGTAGVGPNPLSSNTPGLANSLLKTVPTASDMVAKDPETLPASGASMPLAAPR
jgi:hypothetical protein